MRILHKIRSPEKEKVKFTLRELNIIHYYLGLNSTESIKVVIPKTGRKKIYRNNNWWSNLTYSWYMNPGLSEEQVREQIRWDAVTLQYN